MHPGTIDGTVAEASSRRLVNPLIAACGVLIFSAVSLASGKLDVAGGLGWDGRLYAEMVVGDLADGSPNTRTRPLLVLLTRIPYAAGLGVIGSFHLLNHVYAFWLYLMVCLLLDRYRAATPVKAIIIGNLALCIATSKMFAYYPVQIDLGALAVITLAFYLIATDRWRLAGAACVLAVTAREFGAAVALYALHRSIRQRRPWFEGPLACVSAITAIFLIRWWSESQPGSGGPLGAGDVFENLALWGSSRFVATYFYFAATVFGGISALLIVRPRWCMQRLRHEPELLTFLVLIVGASAVGSLDIWRYLVFALPVAIVLTAQYCAETDAMNVRRVLAVVTAFTVLTQRPFERMDTVRYFRDWFPLYGAAEGSYALWSARVAVVILMGLTLFLIARTGNRPAVAS